MARTCAIVIDLVEKCYLLMSLDVVQELCQAESTPWPAHDPTVESNRHHFGGCGTLGIQNIECVLEVVEESVSLQRLRESHIVVVQPAPSVLVSTTTTAAHKGVTGKIA